MGRNLTPRGEVKDFLTNTVLNFAKDDCLIWPYATARKGYASYKNKDFKSTRVSRIVCEATHGEAPSQQHHAAHRCGVNACVNPRHIYWATPAENEKDKVGHGTSPTGERHGHSKLKETDVRVIRELLEVSSLAEIARQYNVTPSSVWAIKTGKTWVHVQ